MLLATWSAKCPKPPIPMTATRSPDRGLAARYALIAEKPPQKSGAANSGANPSGNKAQPSASAIMYSAWPPPLVIQVLGCEQNLSCFFWQYEHRPQPA
jgi:hypothetical protein